MAWMNSLLVLAPQGESLAFLRIGYRQTPVAFKMAHDRCNSIFGEGNEMRTSFSMIKANKYLRMLSP